MMDHVDYPYICKIMGGLSGVPVRLYREGTLVFTHSVVELPWDPMTPYKEEIARITEHVGYFITPRFLCYGILNAGQHRIVFGPTAQVLPNDQSLRELAFQADVPKEETIRFTEGIKALARLPLATLLTMLCAINYFLNGETLELSDIAIHEAEQLQLKADMERRRTEKKYDSDPNPQPHNTLQLEETLMGIVSKGDSAALRQWIAKAPPVQGGVLAGDQLRQLKNTFIVTATLISRAAIRGGLNEDDAFSLSDSYICQVEFLRDQAAITNLQYSMVLEFTEQVERIRCGAKPTKLALEVSNYVQRHLSETIRTEAMAREFFLTRTHFSARFKKETGETLTQFILKEKMEEAKRLLRYSDKSSGSIGAYLGYSSQGHFSRVFKSYTGKTPSEYREKN